jgi:glycosyltransferase involved in cell wall biosynthesis
MVSGVPVLVSRIPPHEEIAGESVLFFEIDDKNDLKDKLKEICLNNNLRENLITKERKQIKKFSWRRSATEFSHIYREI